MSELLSIFLFLISIAIFSLKAGRNAGWFIGVISILGLCVVLNITLFACNYFTGDGINDAVLYTLTSSLTGAGISKYILPGIGLLVGLVAIFGLLAWVLRCRQNAHRWGYSLLAFVTALASVGASPAFHQIVELVKSHFLAGDPDFGQYYREPAQTIARPHLNLVYIYGESLERTYFDAQAFPDLAPELNAIKKQSLDFSQTEQLPGTDYTIAGMVASQCGIPLFAPFEGNASSAVSSFFPQIRCLGDILNNAGYQNYFVQGANLRFGGKDVFLKSHGFQHLYGAEELATVVADPHYRNDWGFYDDVVLDDVWQKFQQLSLAKKPFSLFALTVDTHHPDGFISRGCQRKSYQYDGKMNQSFGAVTCSQQLIAQLIDKIKASPWFKNTVIVVSSDHLAMNNTAWKYLNQHPRKDLFFVIRGDKPDVAEVSDVKRSTLDNGATVLDILGGDKSLGLGRSSLSGKSLSGTLANLRDKILAWKPAVIALWNFPRAIDRFTVDTAANSISFSGSRFQLPLLLKVKSDRVEPLPQSEYSAPLRYQLADFTAQDDFVWVDRCFKMARIWAPEWALSTDYCVAQGQLGGMPAVSHINTTQWQSSVKFGRITTDTTRFDHNVQQLKIGDNDIRYSGKDFIFNIPGAPATVAQFSGISRPELWGRWSNANLAPEVKIAYRDPLPENFAVTITARAFGPNAGKPIPVRVGDSEQTLILGHEMTTTTLNFANPTRSNVLTITPPDPQLTNEGNILGHSPRKLGIGMAEIKIGAPAPGN